jgi:hypothetical protein
MLLLNSETFSHNHVRKRLASVTKYHQVTVRVLKPVVGIGIQSGNSETDEIRHSREGGNPAFLPVISLDSRLYLKVRDDYAGVDGNLGPRTCALARPCRTDESSGALGTSVAPDPLAALSCSVETNMSWWFAGMTGQHLSAWPGISFSWLEATFV